MKIKIYGERLSRTERVLWAADECGLEYDHDPVPVSGDKGEALLAVNPDGAIPTLDDNGFIMTQSMAITIYLGSKYGGDLAAKTKTEEGEILRWSFWAATDVESSIISLIHASGIIPTDVPDPEEFKSCEDKLQRPFASLERHLEGSTYITGERFTMGDLNAVSIVSWLVLTAFDFGSFPNVRAWVDRCASRPEFPKRG